MWWRCDQENVVELATIDVAMPESTIPYESWKVDSL